MLTLWFRRWRRYKLCDNYHTGRLDIVHVLHRYLRFSHHLSYTTVDYRRRMPYQVSVKGPYITALLDALDDVYQHVQQESYDVDRLKQYGDARQLLSLDAWLLDDQRRPITEPEAITELHQRLEPLIDILITLHHTHPGLYSFYGNTLTSLLKDAFETVDALSAISLGVKPHDRRYTPPTVIGRPR